MTEAVTDECWFQLRVKVLLPPHLPNNQKTNDVGKYASYQLQYYQRRKQRPYVTLSAVVTEYSQCTVVRILYAQINWFGSFMFPPSIIILH